MAPGSAAAESGECRNQSDQLGERPREAAKRALAAMSLFSSVQSCVLTYGSKALDRGGDWPRSRPKWLARLALPRLRLALVVAAKKEGTLAQAPEQKATFNLRPLTHPPPVLYPSHCLSSHIHHGRLEALYAAPPLAAGAQCLRSHRGELSLH